MINVLVIDDHEIIREAVTEVLRKTPGLYVVGSFDSSEQFEAQAKGLSCDVAVIDYMLPGMSGIDLARSLLTSNRCRNAIILTQFVKSDVVRLASQAGVKAVVAKEMAVESLSDAIAAVSIGRYYLCPLFMSLVYRDAGLLAARPKEEPSGLTKREIVILKHLLRGTSRMTIANELFISPSTVTTHRRRIMAKLKVHSTAELVKAAVRLGLTT